MVSKCGLKSYPVGRMLVGFSLKILRVDIGRCSLGFRSHSRPLLLIPCSNISVAANCSKWAQFQCLRQPQFPEPYWRNLHLFRKNIPAAFDNSESETDRQHQKQNLNPTPPSTRPNPDLLTPTFVWILTGTVQIQGIQWILVNNYQGFIKLGRSTQIPLNWWSGSGIDTGQKKISSSHNNPTKED
jgi:hypothetical protein